MQNAGSGCKWGTDLEAYVFCDIRRVNLIIYQDQAQDDLYYHERERKIVDPLADTICIYFMGENKRHELHFQSMFPHQDLERLPVKKIKHGSSSCSEITVVHPAISIDRTNTTNDGNDNDVASGKIEQSSSLSTLFDKRPNIMEAMDNKFDDMEDVSKIGPPPSLSEPLDMDVDPSLHVTKQIDTNPTTETDPETTTSFMDDREIKNMCEHLTGMDIQDLKALYQTVRSKLIKHNGYVVDFSPILTAILGSHSNSLLLGASEQSRVAGLYLGPYVDKGKTNLADSLDLVFESLENVRVHPSVAIDTGTTKRFAQHVLTRILNLLNSLMEISDTQAAAALLGLIVLLSSEIFTVCDIKACINQIKNEKRLAEHRDSEEEEQEIIGEADDSDSEEGFIDDEDVDEENVENASNVDCAHGFLESLLTNNDELREDCHDEGMLFRRIRSTLQSTKDTLTSPQLNFYYSSYGSCPLYSVDDGKRMVLIP
jgi:hypothetical protein